MAYAQAWSESSPDGSEDADTLDTIIDNKMIAIRERMNDVLSNAWETDASNPKLLDGSAFAAGDITYAARAAEYAKVSLNSNETIGDSSPTPIPWDDEDEDQGGLVDLVSHSTRITIVNDGLYLFVCSIAWATDATGVRVLTLKQSGTTTLCGHILTSPSGSTANHQTLTYLGTLSAAAYIEAYAYQSSGGPLDINTAYIDAFMSCVRLA